MKKTKMLSPDDIAKAMGFAAAPPKEASSYYRQTQILRADWPRLRAFIRRARTPAAMIAVALLVSGCGLGAKVGKGFARIPEASAWEKALWFTSANGFLGGRRPVDLLTEDPDSVVDAARREFAVMAVPS